MAVAPSSDPAAPADPKRPWWKRNAPVVGGGKRKGAQPVARRAAAHPAPDTVVVDPDDVVTAVGGTEGDVLDPPSDPLAEFDTSDDGMDDLE